jgi:hypothetical protein
MEDDYEYALQTIRDNVALFTPEVLDKINQVVRPAGLRWSPESKKNMKIDIYHYFYQLLQLADIFTIKANPASI